MSANNGATEKKATEGRPFIYTTDSKDLKESLPVPLKNAFP